MLGKKPADNLSNPTMPSPARNLSRSAVRNLVAAWSVSSFFIRELYLGFRTVSFLYALILQATCYPLPWVLFSSLIILAALVYAVVEARPDLVIVVRSVPRAQSALIEPSPSDKSIETATYELPDDCKAIQILDDKSQYCINSDEKTVKARSRGKEFERCACSEDDGDVRRPRRLDCGRIHLSGKF